MAGKKTEQEIKQIYELYDKLKNYSATARELKIAPSTVSKYIKLRDEEQGNEQAEKIEFQGDIKDIKDIPKPASKEEWQKILEYSQIEWDECEQLRKEGVL